MTTSSGKQVIDFELASSYRRVIARLIDLGFGFFVILTISMVISEVIKLLFKLNQDMFTTLSMIIFFLLLVGYDVLMHRLLGKTVGNMVLGLGVVDLKGDKLSLGMCVLRAVL